MDRRNLLKRIALCFGLGRLFRSDPLWGDDPEWRACCPNTGLEPIYARRGPDCPRAVNPRCLELITTAANRPERPETRPEPFARLSSRQTATRPLTALLGVLLAFSAATALAIPGDGNGDGTVDGLDYQIWVDHFDEQTTAGAAAGDYNGDGKVGGPDYLVWQAYFGQSDPPDPDPDTPEPTLYVATSGSDSNAGTAERPFRSIQKALDVAVAGDWIEVAGGVYASARFVHSGTVDRPLTLAAAPSADVVIEGGSRCLTLQNVDHIVLADLRLRNATRDGMFAQNVDGLVISSVTTYRNRERGLKFEACSGLMVADVTSYENGIDGVYIRESQQIDLARVIANNNGDSDNENGIILQNCQNAALTDCQAHNNGEDGIDLGGYEQYQGDMKNVVLTRCVVANNKDQGFGCSGAANGEFQTHDITYDQCRAINNRDDGIHIYQNAYKITLRGGELSNNKNPWYVYLGARDILFDGVQYTGTGKPATSDPSRNIIVRN